MNYQAGKIDVAVIGAGHAGIEASLAAARLGCKTVVFTINLDAVGNCPCNPSIGGTAKGHLVREIDALGGEMGRTTDECFLQSRMLNRGKGPAVHSLRMQIDRREYSKIMKRKLERQPNLLLKQAEVVAITRGEEGRWNVETRFGAVFEARAVIFATGTYLSGKIFVGEVSYESGPDGMFPAAFLSESLRKLGIRLRRFKTGTPARVLRSSIDFTNLEVQKGDDPVIPFSYDTLVPGKNRAVCYVSWTNEQTKKIILNNLQRSQLFTGGITGIGPRYCPSIETKIIRFADKKRHQLFIEPCGLDTEEMYLQGMSTSLPEEVQIAFYHTIPGLEHVELMRTAYAIEYDCADPQQLNATLEFKDYPGLYGAGQFNGSSGYEEAAAQGLIAGINAALLVQEREPFILKRSEAYLGVLIDDLVTKELDEPYRLLTSRAEYRLLLRQDNADLRLTEKGRAIGLVDDRRMQVYETKKKALEQNIDHLQENAAGPSDGEINRYLVDHGSVPLKDKISLWELLRRPEVDIADYVQMGRLPALDEQILQQMQVQARYEGYIKKQQEQVIRFEKMEMKHIPENINYDEVYGLSNEALQKLKQFRPASIGQASRIAGVNPADISVLLIFLEKKRRK